MDEDIELDHDLHELTEWIKENSWILPDSLTGKEVIEVDKLLDKINKVFY